MSLWPFLRIRTDVSRAAYRTLIAGAREELRKDGLKLYMNMYVDRTPRFVRLC